MWSPSVIPLVHDINPKIYNSFSPYHHPNTFVNNNMWNAQWPSNMVISSHGPSLPAISPSIPPPTLWTTQSNIQTMHGNPWGGFIIPHNNMIPTQEVILPIPIIEPKTTFPTSLSVPSVNFSKPPS
jgi:hypothetical protein